MPVKGARIRSCSGVGEFVWEMERLGFLCVTGSHVQRVLDD